MNILLTAKNSFISKSILPLLIQQGYNVDCLTKSELNLTNLEQLRKAISSKRYDIVINPAIAGEGRLLHEDSLEDFYNNCLMIENLLYLQKIWNFKLLQFTSGAGNERSKEIINLLEKEITPPPINRYSLAKYICNRRIENNTNIVNIRIFNCFGELERSNRFISTCINKCLKNETIEIWGDKQFDFFYIEDLFILINFYLKNWPDRYEEINAVYDKKYTLFDIARYIKDINNTSILIKIDNTIIINNHYTGNGFKLKSLNLPILGLYNGIKKMYYNIINERI